MEITLKEIEYNHNQLKQKNDKTRHYIKNKYICMLNNISIQIVRN